MTESEGAAGTIGVLVVHGIGAQERGETLAKLLAGLSRVDPAAGLETIQDGQAATIGGQPVRFFEVYWADVLKGEHCAGAFQMDELQSLSWFPFFNWLRGNYPRGRYALPKLIWWCVVLPIVNFLILFAYYGTSLVVQVFTGTTSPHKKSGKPTVLDGILDEYAGDVLVYVNSAGSAFHRDGTAPPVTPAMTEAYKRIVRCFHDQLVRAHADGCSTIQVVAHSLGTVVTFHALSGLQFDSTGRDDADVVRAAGARVSHVYSIGSPIEKIRFFWPRLAPKSASIGGGTIRWDNFVSWFDPVAGSLRPFEDWAAPVNRRLLGGGFLRGHVVYERSPIFIGAFSKGLVGRDLPYERTRKERLQDMAVLVGETVLTPVAVGLLLLVGAALFVATAMLVPFLFSLAVRWFLPAETWAPIVDAASLVFLGLMSLAFLVAPMIRAKRVHALHWAPRTDKQ